MLPTPNNPLKSPSGLIMAEFIWMHMYIDHCMHYNDIKIHRSMSLMSSKSGAALVWSWSLWMAQTTRLLLLMRRTLKVHIEGREGEGRAHH